MVTVTGLSTLAALLACWLTAGAPKASVPVPFLQEPGDEVTGFSLVCNESTQKLRLRTLASRQIAIAKAMAHGQRKIALELSRTCVSGYRELGDAGGEAACLLGQRWAEMEGGDWQAAEDTLQQAHLAAAKIPSEARMSLADYILMGQSFLSFPPPDYRRAVSYFKKALTLAQDQKDRSSKAFVLDRLGFAEVGREDLSNAEEHLEAALETARSIQEDEILALCLHDLAILYQSQGRSEEAKSLLVERVEIVSRGNDRRQQAEGLRDLGDAYLVLHENEAALTSLQRAEALLADNSDDVWPIRKSIAEALTSLGKLSQAAEIYEEALRHFRAVATEHGRLPGLLAGAAEVLDKQGSFNEAKASLEEALDIWRKLDHVAGEIDILTKLGLLAHRQKFAEEALKKFEEASSLARTANRKVDEAVALFNIARIHLETGNLGEAWLRYSRALDVALSSGNVLIQASVLADQTRILIAWGRTEEAEVLAEKALALARDIGSAQHESDALALQETLLDLQRTESASNVRIRRDEALTSEVRNGEMSALATETAEALAEERWAAAADLSRACAASYSAVGDDRGEILCLLGLGRAEFHRGNHRQALEALQQALSALTGKPWGTDLEMSCRLLLAESYQARQLYDDAVAHLEYGLSLARSSRNRHSEAAFLDRLGFVETQRERWREAEEHLKAALAIAREVPMADDLLALSLRHLAALYKDQGRFPSAAELLEEAAQLARQRNSLSDEISSLQLLGSVSLDLHKYDEALAALRKAEALLVAEESPVRLWAVRKEIGRTLAQLGKLPEALALYEEAISYYRSLNDEIRLPPLLAAAAQVLARQGRSQEQRAYLEEALSIRRREGDRNGEAVILSELGHFEFQRNFYDESLKRFEESLSLYRAIRSKIGALASLFNSAHLYFELGRHEEALLRYQQALWLARELQSHNVEAGILRDMARLLISQGRLMEAYERVEESLMLAKRVGSPPAEIDALNMKGYILGRCGCGRNDEAFALFSQALSLSERLPDPRSKLKVLLSISQLQLSIDSPAAAIRTLEAVLAGRRSLNTEFQEEIVLKLLADAYQDLGQIDRSIDFYRQALAAEDSILDRTSTDDFLLHQARHSAEVAQPLIQLLAGSGRNEEAFAVVENTRSRAFLRQIRDRPLDLRRSLDAGLLAEADRLRKALRELNREIRSETQKPFDERDQVSLEVLSSQADAARQQYETLLIRLKQTNPEYSSLLQPAPLSLFEVQRLLDPKTTLVEYFVQLDQTLVWVIDRSSYHFVRLPLSAQAISEKVALWRGQISDLKSSAELESAMYRELIAPLEPYLQHRILIIVPHDSLQWLSFAALRDAEGTALNERFSLAYLPSASILSFLAAKRSPNEGQLLAIGDPDGSLPHAAAEVRAIASLYETHAFVGRQASEAILRDRSRGIDVLHIAAHSTLDSARPLFSRLQLAPTPEDDGSLELHEVFSLDLTDTNLVVLSGCDTGRGSLEQGDDPIGWSRAFLHSGAAAVVTTLWPIDDVASAALMTSFHRHLREGLSVAESLQRAQKEIAQQEGWSSPYFWAGFTLTGYTSQVAPTEESYHPTPVERITSVVPPRKPDQGNKNAPSVASDANSRRRMISLEIAAARAIARQRWEEVAQRCRECADGYQELGDLQGEAYCLLGLALGENKRGDAQASTGALLEGLVASARRPQESDLPLSHHVLQAEVYLTFPLHDEEAVAHLEKALLLARAQQDQFAEALVLNRLGSVALKRGHLAEAAEPLEGALRIARKDHQQDLLGGFLYDLAILYSKQSRFTRAAELLEEASALARRQDEPKEEAASLQALGEAYLAVYEADKALPCLLRADSLLAQMGDQDRLWVVRKDIAKALACKGELTRALALYDDAIEHYRRVDEAWQIPPLLMDASEILGRQDRPGEERAYLEEALRIWLDMGHRLGEANVLVKLGLLDITKGSPEESLERFEEAIAAARAVKSRTSEGEALLNSARSHFNLGHHEEARLRYEQALHIARELGNLALEASVLRDLARF